MLYYQPKNVPKAIECVHHSDEKVNINQQPSERCTATCTLVSLTKIRLKQY